MAIEIILRCDSYQSIDCIGGIEEGGSSLKITRDYAKNNGWIFHQGKDYCPECKKEESVQKLMNMHNWVKEEDSTWWTHKCKDCNVQRRYNRSRKFGRIGYQYATENEYIKYEPECNN